MINLKRIKFIHRIQRRLFRNHIDNLVVFVGNSKDQWYKNHRIFKVFTNKCYNIDNSIEYFIRNH